MSLKYRTTKLLKVGFKLAETQHNSTVFMVAANISGYLGHIQDGAGYYTPLFDANYV